MHAYKFVRPAGAPEPSLNRQARSWIVGASAAEKSKGVTAGTPPAVDPV